MEIKIKHIILFVIVFFQINAFADPDKQPSIDSTKYIVISGDTLNVYLFWKQNISDYSLIRSESKITVKSKEWKGGEFFMKLNKDRTKIILQEVINPWRQDEEILNQIETKKMDLKLEYAGELGYWNDKLWFIAYGSNEETEILKSPIIGYFDLKSKKSNYYYLYEYYPENEEVYKTLIWTYYYKGKMIFYMDNSNYLNPTENVIILCYDGEFKELEIKKIIQ